MNVTKRGAWAAGLLAIAFLASGAQAQTTVTTTTDVKNFEILAVDGNYLVVRDAGGTRELHVPSDFRFNVGGKPLGVADLKAGMKGTAAVTRTTTTRQVVVTDVKNGTVLSQTGRSVVIKEDTGKIHRFSQSGIDERGVQLYMGDKPIRVFNLEPGDKVSARIVTVGPPEVMTQTQVDAELAKAPPPPAAAPEPEATPVVAAATPAADPAPEPAAEPEVAPAEPAPTPEAAPAPEPTAAAPAEEPSRTWLWIVLLLVLLLVLWLILRNKDKNKK